MWFVVRRSKNIWRYNIQNNTGTKNYLQSIGIAAFNRSCYWMNQQNVRMMEEFPAFVLILWFTIMLVDKTVNEWSYRIMDKILVSTKRIESRDKWRRLLLRLLSLAATIACIALILPSTNFTDIIVEKFSGRKYTRYILL